MGFPPVDQIGAQRRDDNHARPYEAIAWNWLAEDYAGSGDPTIPGFEIEKTGQPLDAGHTSQ